MFSSDYMKAAFLQNVVHARQFLLSSCCRPILRMCRCFISISRWCPCSWNYSHLYSGWSWGYTNFSRWL